jgi:acyl carrier protein
MSSIPPDEALNVLEEVIKQDVVQLSVLPIDWVQLQSAIPSLGHSPFLEDLVAGEQQERAGASAGAKEMFSPDLLRAMDPAQRQQTLTEKLQAEAERVLRLPRGKLNLTCPLNQFGLDSLMALELKNRMQAQWGITVPLVNILSGPSVTDLASLILEMLADAAEKPSSNAGKSEPENGFNRSALDRHSAEELLRRLPELSDDEVDSFLKQIANSS